ncbi:MAG: hypothetical protein E7046_04470 [Lentisphaerae bacterium]|nr:hypothetical protein [Lentisphaerota bacterium]
MIAKLQPNRVRRMYLGGGRIDAFSGVSANVSDGVPRPEDWLASTTQAFNGALEIEGEGLGRLEDGRLVKDAVGPLPILVKLLDSDERLVIQAHPTVQCAKRLFNSPVGKTECWYFLPGTAPDACVYLGFKPGVTRAAWELAVLDSGRKERKVRKDDQDNLLLPFLHRIPIAPGDFVFVEGGVPHAIGAGCFMVELQEPSDLMVVAERFTPSGRRIPDAKLHGGVGWGKMFDVYEYDGRTFEETCAKYVRKFSAGTGEVHICGPEFTDKFEMWRLCGGGKVCPNGNISVVAVTDGEGAINGVCVKRGDRLVIADEVELLADGSVSAIVCFKTAKGM